LAQYNPISIAKNSEYGGLINRIPNEPYKGQYIYTYPNTNDNPDQVEYPEPCENTVGTYHTHSARIDGDGSPEYFSDTDMNLADEKGWTFYLGTPEGRMKTYTPWKNRPNGTNPNPLKGAQTTTKPGYLPIK